MMGAVLAQSKDNAVRPALPILDCPISTSVLACLQPMGIGRDAQGQGVLRRPQRGCRLWRWIRKGRPEHWHVLLQLRHLKDLRLPAASIHRRRPACKGAEPRLSGCGRACAAEHPGRDPAHPEARPAAWQMKACTTVHVRLYDTGWLVRQSTASHIECGQHDHAPVAFSRVDGHLRGML